MMIYELSVREVKIQAFKRDSVIENFRKVKLTGLDQL